MRGLLGETSIQSAFAFIPRRQVPQIMKNYRREVLSILNMSLPQASYPDQASQSSLLDYTSTICGSIFSDIQRRAERRWERWLRLRLYWTNLRLPNGPLYSATATSRRSKSTTSIRLWSPSKDISTALPLQQCLSVWRGPGLTRSIALMYGFPIHKQRSSAKSPQI